MEAPLALYRRYRPDTFAQVIGQDHVTGPLRTALRNNRVNHAYLFSGPRGCGKTTSARILARALNCAEGPVEEPCGRCESCRDLSTGGPGSVDVIEIDAASHGRVEDTRELREQATFQPMRDRFKVYIIDEAHMVTPQGFNALLKIVEEPPEHVRFIFATTEPEKVIGTIRSRTHHYPFRLIPPRVLSSYLKELCEREKVAVEPAALPLVVRAGGGSARDTLSVLDQLMGGAGEEGVTYTLAAGLLGYTPDTLLDEVVDALAAQDGSTVFAMVEKIMEIGQDPRRFTEDLLQRLRDLVVLSAVPDAPATGLIDVPEDQAERLVAQAARFGRHDLSRLADLVAQGLADLKGTTAPRLQLELLCARILLPGAEDSTRGYGARLDRLERRLSLAGDASTATEAPSAAAAPPAAATQRPAPTAERPAPAAERSAAERPAPVAERPAPAAKGSAAAEQPVASVASPGQDAPAASQDAAGGSQDAPARPGLTVVDLRRLWPDIIDAVKSRRRVTWIQLSQHAQVVGVEGRTLTLGFNNPGARESFVNGRSDLIVSQVLFDLVGDEWRVEAVVDHEARPAAAPSSGRGASGGGSRDAGSPSAGSRSAGSDDSAQTPGAGAAGTPTRPGEQAGRAEPSTASRGFGGPAHTSGEHDPATETSGAERDDLDDEDSLDGTQLLSDRLGAQVVEEIPHD